MKAFVLIEKDKAMLTEMPEPVMKEDDVIARPTCLAACTSDVHLIHADNRPNAIGKTLGHEGVGIVEAVGSKVQDFKPGDRVLFPSAGANFQHPRAQRGEAKYFQTNNATYSPDPTVQGLFSERVRVVDADRRLAHIPDNVTDEQAVMVSDMMATGFTGVRRMNILYGETVLILGCGPVGLMGIAAAKLRGAGRIIAVGSRPNTLKLAELYGASDIIDYKAGPILEQVMALTSGQQVDSTLVASGGSASDIFSTALQATKFGGTVSNVSIFLDEDTVTLPLSVWNGGCREKWLTSIAIDDGRDSFERLLQLISFGRVDPAPLITHRTQGLESIGEAIQLMGGSDRSVIKVITTV